jgi:uncharacterized protein YdgA (DUF945 family)
MKRKREIGLAVLLTVIIMAVGPFFIGWLFQYRYQQAINSVNSSDLFHVKVQSYERGWYRSKVLLNIELPLNWFNVFTLSDPVNKSDKITINLIEEINHGPFFYPNRTNDYHFLGLAVLYNEWAIPEETQQRLQKIGLTHFVFSKDNVYVSLFANYQINLHLEKIQFADKEKNSNLQLDSIALKGLFFPRQQRLRGELVINDFMLRINHDQWSIPHLIVDFDRKMQEYSLWTGKLNLSLSELIWCQMNQKIFSLTDAHFNGDSKQQNNSLSIDRSIDIHKIQLNDEIFGPFNLRLSVNKLDAQAISNLIKAYLKISINGQIYRDQLKLKILSILPNIINPGTKLQIKNLLLLTPEGRVQTQGKIFWPENQVSSPDTMYNFIKEVPVYVSLKISTPLLNRLINFFVDSPYFNPYSQEEIKKIIEARSEVDLNFKQNAQLILKLGELYWLNQEDQELLLFYARDLDFSQAYLEKIRSLFLSREISRYVAYLLYFQYSNLLHQIDVLDTIVDKHNNEAKRWLFQILAKSVDKGLINRIDDDYITTITRENEDIKLNGKTLTY